MIEITHKEQGNGKDSWTITEWEDSTKDVMIDRKLVYANPGTAEVYTERLKYEQRKIDGVNAYLNIAAEFRLSPLSRDIRKNLESRLEAVRNELVNGQWITSLEKLEECTVTGNLTQEIYDRLHLSLTTYITNNY